MRKIFIVFLLAGGGWFSNVGSEELEKELREMSLEELLNVPVTAATRREQKATEAPATVYVYTDEMIRYRGYRKLEDLLDSIPEVEVHRKSDGIFNNNIVIRGLSPSDRFVILINGIRISSPTGETHPVATNFPLTHAKRVEVILGPASALYGADAFAGVINIIPYTEEDLKGGRLLGSFSSFGTREGTFTAGVKIWEDFSVIATADIYHSDEPFFPKFYPREYDWFLKQYSTQGNMLKLDGSVIQVPILPYRTPTDSYFLHLEGQAGNFRFGYMRNNESHSTSVTVKPEFAIYSEDARWETILENLYLQHEFESPSRKWKLQTLLSRAFYEIDPTTKFVNVFTGYRGGFEYEMGRSVHFQEQITYTINPQNTFILGLSFQDISALPETADLPFPFDRNLSADEQGLFYLGTDVVDVNGRDLRLFQDFHYLNYQNRAAYVQLQSRLWKNVEITLGTRYDFNTRYEATWNPRLGLLFTPRQDWKLKILYGEAFSEPSPRDAFGHFGSFEPVRDSAGNIIGLQSSFLHLPNPQLQPEKLRTAEFNLLHYLNEDLAVYADFYYTKLNNLIGTSPLSNQVFKGIPVLFARTVINEGKATIYGGTLRLNYVWRRHGFFTNIYGSYSYLNGHVLPGTGIKDKIPYSSAHTFKVGVDWRYGKWSFSAFIPYRSEGFHQRKDSRGKQIRNEPFTLLHLYVRYSNLWSRDHWKLSVAARIDNATDKRYFNLREGGGSTDLLLTPQDPRRFQGTLELEF